MEGLLKQRQTERRIGQTEVIEKPGVVTAWTPTYIGQATAGVTTYSIQQGSYTRLGPIIIAFGRVAWTAATGTGAALISIPVTAVYTNVSRYVVYVYPVNVTFANGSIAGVLDNATSAVAFLMNSPATNAAGTLIAVEAAGDLSFTAVYEVG